MYPSTIMASSVSDLSALALSKLYKFEPFLKKAVSGELIYFAK